MPLTQRCGFIMKLIVEDLKYQPLKEVAFEHSGVCELKSWALSFIKDPIIIRWQRESNTNDILKQMKDTDKEDKQPLLFHYYNSTVGFAFYLDKHKTLNNCFVWISYLKDCIIIKMKTFVNVWGKEEYWAAELLRMLCR